EKGLLYGRRLAHSSGQRSRSGCLDSSAIESAPPRSVMNWRCCSGRDVRFIARPPQSGRIEGRVGLRLCRRFLDPPYHSVRRVFPDTAARLTFQTVPSQTFASLRLLPAYTGKYLVCVRPSCTFVATSLIPHCVGPSARSRTVVEGGSSSAPGVLALVRVMLSR